MTDKININIPVTDAQYEQISHSNAEFVWMQF